MSILSAIGVGEWAAVVGVALAVLGAVGGFIWWMSALYSEVKGIRESFDSFVEAHRDEHSALWERINSKADK